MKLAGRLAAAIEILADVETRHRPASDVLKDWGLSHRFAGSGDRGVIGNIVYDALRWRSSSAWVMGEETPRAAVLATVARRWGVGAEGLAAAIADEPHGPGALSEAEASRLATADLAMAPSHVRGDLPEWAAGRLERSLGGDWVAEGEALAERPPLDMRANRLKADPTKVVKALAAFGAAEVPFSPDGVRIAATAKEGRHPNVQVEPAFQKGWFEIQDEGSQIAALLAAVRPGSSVLDFCAGAGGKTLALAAAMGGKGRLVATDSDRNQLAPIFDRVKRAGAHNVEVRPARAALDDLVERMDVVLVDAPCTGSGTWRRRPEAKWRLTERALNNRVGEQAAILAEAARFVKPGGRLLYVTCSLLPEENGDQVAAFVAAHPAFSVVAPAQAIGEAGLPEALAEPAIATDRGIILTPRRTATDGFFVSVLRR